MIYRENGFLMVDEYFIRLCNWPDYFLQELYIYIRFMLLGYSYISVYVGPWRALPPFVMFPNIMISRLGKGNFLEETQSSSKLS